MKILDDKEFYDIAAEFFLNYMYPDKEEEWIPNCEGAFVRNYSRDILAVEDRQVRLSRNGFIHLLPDGLVSAENELSGSNFNEKYETLKKKMSLLHDLFMPLDSMVFRQRLHLETRVEALLRDRIADFLRIYFHYDWLNEPSPWVRKIAPMLLQVRRYRADFGLIREVLQALLEQPVKMKVGKYTWGEDLEQSQPQIKYEVSVLRLSAGEYTGWMEKLKPLEEFIEEWFMPFDTRCLIEVKQRDVPFDFSRHLVLDYNTRLPVEPR